MKKYFSLFLAFILVFLFSNVSVFANSGPVYIEKTPNFENFHIDSASPILVADEKLIFDFSKPSNSSSSIPQYGVITANYTMQNPASENHTSTMVFPFVGNLRDLSNELNLPSIKIKDNYTQEDNEFYSADYELIITDYNYDFNNLDMNDILNEIGYLNHDVSKPLTKYTLTYPLPKDEDIYMVYVGFAPDSNARIIADEKITGYSGGDEGVVFSTRVYSNDTDTLNFYTYGDIGDITVSLAKVENNALEYFNADDFEYILEESQTDTLAVYDLALEIHNININDKTRIYSILDDYLFHNLYITENLIVPINELSMPLLQDNLMVLLYEVDFEGQETKNVVISYNMKTGFDAQSYNSSLFPVQYIIDPARHWKEFNSIDISVLTNDVAPYIQNSNIDFTLTGDNTYTYSATSLPSENITFSLSEKENLSSGNIYYITILIPIILAILVFIRFNKKK